MSLKFPAFEPIKLKNEDILEVSELLISKIIPDENQPRRNFDSEALNELASSIKKYGIIQPILVKRISNDGYKIIAGERRWRASQLAELTSIPAIIQENDEQKNIAISLIENIQREALNPIELAEAFYQLSSNHGLSHEDIASIIGKSRTTVTNLLRLLSVPKLIREFLIDGKIEMGHARALLTLPEDQQLLLSEKIVGKNLSVRDVEKIAQLHKLPKSKNKNIYSKDINEWVRKISPVFSSKVDIDINDSGEGRVTIHFSSSAEIDWLAEQLNDCRYEKDF